MFQKQITDREAGQRLDKYLHKLLPEAGTGFLYKRLRKKNITLNGKKADGSEKTAAGDSVELFFSEETLQKFMGNDIPEEEHAFEEYEKAFQKPSCGAQYCSSFNYSRCYCRRSDDCSL